MTNITQTRQKPPTILMVALEFPPCHSAGVQRTLKFAEYLSKFGWKVIVLTARERVYSAIDQQIEVDPDISVYRVFALDSARDFALQGKYFGWSKVPDRWWSWALSAIPKGKRLIRQYQPDIIWSTYPASTAHFIAWRLKRASGLPWVADYRDPLQCRYDEGVQKYSAVAKWIEKETINNAAKVVFTTSAASRMYQRLYPRQPVTKFVTIQNGYDDQNFANLPTVEPLPQDRLVLLHSGSVYPDGRDPGIIFEAIANLKRQGLIDQKNFLLVFRGQKDDRLYRAKLQQLYINELVSFRAGIPYLESLAEMKTAGAMLIIQGPLFNNQIPGKVFDCLRIARPILALTPQQGSTAHLLASTPGCYSAEDAEQAEQALKILLKQRAMCSDSEEDVSLPISVHSRYTKAQLLNEVLHQILLGREEYISEGWVGKCSLGEDKRQ